MTLDEDLDTLYGVAPEEFTALRKELATAAKKTGRTDVATAIAGARRPTTAAWVVNLLVRADPTAKTRLGELTAHLRAAHAAMDGVRIRELSAVQRGLVTELVRTAFAAADLAEPSAALRDDVTDTLQAAIADPEVAARLGRLVKAEHWSGFGDFGASEVEIAVTAPQPAVDRRATEKRRAAAIEKAETARATAAEEVAERTTAVRTARRRYEKLLETLSGAEDAVNVAEERLQDANDDLAQADSVLAELRAESPT
jgi:hypothetical protein